MNLAANGINSHDLTQVTSPFLRSQQPNLPVERREIHRSMEMIERLNFNDLEPFKTSNGEQNRRQNRLSREILGVDDAILSAPDNARAGNNEGASGGRAETAEEEDTSSVAFGGSVASTVPDRYGFIGGNQYTNEIRDAITVDVLRKRELKWLEMIDNWDRYMATKYKKVRDRCRKGIPSSIRPRAWQFLCGGSYLMSQNRGIFDDLVSQPGDPKWLDDIRKDLHRQFPLHEMFQDSSGPGQAELFRVLKAYSVLNPVDGYFQGQAPVAAMLVMHMPAEEAFWCLVAICERYLPGYYSQGLEAIQIDGDILVQLLKKIAPPVHRHLTKQVVDPILYMMEWFMCIYTRTLPWSSVLRVWDMFFCEGVKVLFKVGLVLLKYTFSKTKTLKECPTMYETVDLLRHLPPSVTDENALVARMLKLPINEVEMERVHSKVVQLRKAGKNTTTS